MTQEPDQALGDLPEFGAAARGSDREGMGKCEAQPAGPKGRLTLPALPPGVIPSPASFDLTDDERHIVDDAINAFICFLIAAIVIGSGVLAWIHLAAEK